ncbi:MAG: DUF4382 domain-containing protein [Candidatus Micrarchaeia archaeon]|jgi:hypothetical protein
METKKMPLLFAFAVVAAISLFAAGCAQNGSGLSSGQGRAVFTVADAAADMGTVTSVKVTVDRLEVQHAASGWTTVSSTPYTYDLMQLRASKSQSLMADAKLEAGSYGQVRMHISRVTVTDSSGEHEAKLPSNDLKIVGGFEVKPNATTVVTFDFLADKSVHVAGNGKYILAPVVRMQGREDAEVDASSREDVKVTDGRVRTDTEVGMDAEGNVGVGAGIPANANITIDGGTIVVLGLLPRACTADAKICQDGSVVGRQGPDCEFAACPQGCSKEAKTCPGGSVVGRQGPDCEFEACPKENSLAACIAISSQPERLSCIAMWCGSENRDFNKCYNLTDENDKLGCLNKCNPNSNI